MPPKTSIINSTQKRYSILSHSIFLVFTFTLLNAFCARFSLWIPYLKVPITGQILAVFLTGLFLSPQQALYTQITYLATGLAGWPIFANPPYGGIAYLFTPSFGYLIGFLFQALFISSLTSKEDKLISKVMVLFASLFITYTFGSLWLAIWLKFSTSIYFLEALLRGVKISLTFLPYDFMKLWLALGISQISLKTKKYLCHQQIL